MATFPDCARRINTTATTAATPLPTTNSPDGEDSHRHARSLKLDGSDVDAIVAPRCSRRSVPDRSIGIVLFQSPGACGYLVHPEACYERGGLGSS